MILKWMFPGGKSLPHVVVSHNARFDPVSRRPGLSMQSAIIDQMSVLVALSLEDGSGPSSST